MFGTKTKGVSAASRSRILLIVWMFFGLEFKFLAIGLDLDPLDNPLRS